MAKLMLLSLLFSLVVLQDHDMFFTKIEARRTGPSITMRTVLQACIGQECQTDGECRRHSPGCLCSNSFGIQPAHGGGGGGGTHDCVSADSDDDDCVGKTCRDTPACDLFSVSECRCTSEYFIQDHEDGAVVDPSNNVPHQCILLDDATSNGGSDDSGMEEEDHVLSTGISDLEHDIGGFLDDDGGYSDSDDVLGDQVVPQKY